MSLLMIIASLQAAASSPPANTPEKAVTAKYNTLSGATSSEAAALLTWTENAVTKGYYYKIVAFHVAVGNSLLNKCFNVVDPLNDVAAFKLSLTGGADNAKGIAFAGGTDFANTNIDFTNISGSPASCFGYALDTAIQNYFVGSTVNLMPTLFQSDNAITTAYPNISGSSTGIAYTGGNVVGRKFFRRKNDSSAQFYNDGTLKGSVALTGVSSSQSNILLNKNVSTIQASGSVMKYFICTTELTDLEIANMDSDLSTLLTSLNKN